MKGSTCSALHICNVHLNWILVYIKAMYYFELELQLVNQAFYAQMIVCIMLCSYSVYNET